MYPRSLNSSQVVWTGRPPILQVLSIILRRQRLDQAFGGQPSISLSGNHLKRFLRRYPRSCATLLYFISTYADGRGRAELSKPFTLCSACMSGTCAIAPVYPTLHPPSHDLTQLPLSDHELLPSPCSPLRSVVCSDHYHALPSLKQASALRSVNVSQLSDDFECRNSPSCHVALECDICEFRSCHAWVHFHPSADLRVGQGVVVIPSQRYALESRLLTYYLLKQRPIFFTILASSLVASSYVREHN